MIAYLKGRVLESNEGNLVLSIGGTGSDHGSIGYAVQVPKSSDYLSLIPNDLLELYIHTHVREDALDLFGFRTVDEKKVFLHLVSVSGIGPKAALGFLSGLSWQQLVRTIMGGETHVLTKIPGVGKKTAERVVVELSDLFRKKVDAGHLRLDQSFASKGAPAQRGASLGPEQDALEALIGLGYRASDVQGVLRSLVEGADSKSLPQALDVQVLIRQALKRLGQDNFGLSSRSTGSSPERSVE